MCFMVEKASRVPMGLRKKSKKELIRINTVYRNCQIISRYALIRP